MVGRLATGDRQMWDLFFTLPRESFEWMLQANELRNRMAGAWREAVEASPKSRPEDVMKSWVDSCRGIYVDVFEISTRPLRMAGFAAPAETMPAGEMFSEAQRFFFSAPLAFVPQARDLEGWVEFCRKSQENFTETFQSALESLQAAADAYKSGVEREDEPEKVLRACLESSEGLLEAWIEYASKQSSEVVQLWKSSLTKEKTRAKSALKKAARTKEEAASAVA